MQGRWTPLAAAVLTLCAASQTLADPFMEYVTVGDPGNAPDVRTGFGAVSYTFRIGRFEVTNAQYAAFLNAVAAADPHNLYEPAMAGGWNDIGGILRQGEPGGYTYTARPGKENRPVNYVSFLDACRFANWLHNGRPVGPQGPGTTETGAYDLYHLAEGEIRTFQRTADARVWIPDENEWYKAAYYRGGGTGAGYWLFPTCSDQAPVAGIPPQDAAPPVAANYWDGAYVEPTFYTTEVGACRSPGPYGTFDQGGNLWEWNETIVSPDDRGLRGGAFNSPELTLRSECRDANPANQLIVVGFRVAAVPEPAAAALLLPGASLLLCRRR